MCSANKKYGDPVIYYVYPIWPLNACTRKNHATVRRGGDKIESYILPPNKSAGVRN